MSPHIYERGGKTWHVCRECGTARHSDGYFWFAGVRNRKEPMCGMHLAANRAAHDEWMKTTDLKGRVLYESEGGI